MTLVKHRATDELYALKQIKKERIRGAKHIQHVKNEKNILRAISEELESLRSGHDAESSFFVNFIESM